MRVDADVAPKSKASDVWLAVRAVEGARDWIGTSQLVSTQLGTTMTSCIRNDTISVCASLAFAALTMTPFAASAEDVPLSHVATPDVYKVLDENDQFRVVLATWKPGQRDSLHSHPANATYALTACDVRLYGPDDRVVFNGHRDPGSTVLQRPVAAHSFENVGKGDCQILIVERK
jgi:hypothetical protein